MQGTAEDQTTAADILRLASMWMDAAQARDAAALEQLLADEYRLVVMTLPQGHHEAYDRAEWIAETLRRTIHEFAFTESQVRVDGDVAVMSSRWTSTGTIGRDDGTGAAGTTRPLAAHLTDIWVRRDGRWQVVLRHSIRLAAAV